MEYLVTMTTHVPDGTPAATVDEVRARESAHTRDLAAQGHVLRLWRPPLAPGEWRTIGLFAAADATELERVLASMPLRVWRSDEVKDLGAHPNDPPPTDPPPTAAPPAAGAAAGAAATEFFVTFTPATPEGTPAQDLKEATAGEAARARELTEQGQMIRLWKLSAEHGVPSNLGLYRAADAAAMQAILESLPLCRYGYLTTQTTPLTPHPSDPGAPGSRSRPLPEQTGADRG